MRAVQIRTFGEPGTVLELAELPEPTAPAAGQVLIGVLGIVCGALLGFALARLIGAYIENVQLPGVMPLFGSVAVILVATVLASMLPAMRAARIEITKALRSE